jgi:hypothetical protein
MKPGKSGLTFFFNITSFIKYSSLITKVADYFEVIALKL